jgi:NTP pyrophosphatase (non-canonical NTP hydrolase)
MKLSYDEIEDKYLTYAIDKFGQRSQLDMVDEECGELIVALNHFNRKRVGPEKVAEEIADVILMCAQASRIIGEDLVQKVLDEKVKKFLKLVEDADF